MPDRRAEILRVAEQLRFIREQAGAANRGRWVEALQRVGGTTPGQPWCACYVSAVLGLAYQGKNPLPYTAGCDVLLEDARARGLLVDTPQPGDVFLRLKTDTDADHTGFVREVLAGGKWTTWEGNANAAGAREGNEVCSITRPRRAERYVFIRVPEA